MRYLISNVQINASPARVWKILTDFERYAQWNPFIVSARGQAKRTRTIGLKIAPPGEAVRAYAAQIVVLDWGRKLCWRIQRRFSFRAAPDEQLFLLKSVGGGRAVRFAQRATFTGLVLPLVWPRIQIAFSHGMESMNHALMDRSEAMSDAEQKTEGLVEAPLVQPAKRKPISPARP